MKCKNKIEVRNDDRMFVCFEVDLTHTHLVDIVKVVHLAMGQKELARQAELERHFVGLLVVEPVDVAGVADAFDVVDVVDAADADCIEHLVLRHMVDIDSVLQIGLAVAVVEMVAVELADRTAAVRRDIEVLLLHLKFIQIIKRYYFIHF